MRFRSALAGMFAAIVLTGLSSQASAGLIASINMGRLVFLEGHDQTLDALRGRFPGAGGTILFEQATPVPGDTVSLTSGPVFDAAVADFTDNNTDFMWLFGVHLGIQTAGDGFNDLSALPVLEGQVISEIRWVLDSLTYENINLGDGTNPDLDRTRTTFDSTLSFFGPDDSSSALPTPHTVVLLMAGVLGTVAIRRRRNA